MFKLMDKKIIKILSSKNLLNWPYDACHCMYGKRRRFRPKIRLLTSMVTHALFEPQREKTCLRGFANNKGADQPAHSPSLISAFVIPVLESIISRLAMSEISIVKVVSLAEQVGFSLNLSETLTTAFVTSRPI